MFSREITLTAMNGLHTRPAAQFVINAKQFDCEITILLGDKKANAKSLFELQNLHLLKGAVLTIQAHGQDEEKAVTQLIQFLQALD